MRLSDMSDRALEAELRNIDEDLRKRGLTRREEDDLIADKNAILDELDYRDREARRSQPKENTYGGFNSRNDSPRIERNTKDMGSLFDKIGSDNKASLSNTRDSGLRDKGFKPTETPRENNGNRNTSSNERGSTKPHKNFFIPKYPFITSPNVKEKLDEIVRDEPDAICHIFKREFIGNDGLIEYTMEEPQEYISNPLYINVHAKNIAYVYNISNPIIPNTITQSDNLVNSFIFNEINYDMVNFINAIDCSYKLTSIKDINEFINSDNYKTIYLKHIGKIFRSFKITPVDEYLELSLNKMHIYADVKDMVIPEEGGDKFFVSEESNETLYTIIKNVSTKYNSYSGVIEGLNYRFKFYIGFNKILLVRA